MTAGAAGPRAADRLVAPGAEYSGTAAFLPQVPGDAQGSGTLRTRVHEVFCLLPPGCLTSESSPISSLTNFCFQLKLLGEGTPPNLSTRTDSPACMLPARPSSAETVGAASSSRFCLEMGLRGAVRSIKNYTCGWPSPRPSLWLVTSHGLDRGGLPAELLVPEPESPRSK